MGIGYLFYPKGSRSLCTWYPVSSANALHSSGVLEHWKETKEYAENSEDCSFHSRYLKEIEDFDHFG